MHAQDLKDQPKVRVFASSGALCAEAVTSAKAFPTVNLEFALTRGKTTQWDRKIVIQPDARELPLLAALLLGYRRSLSLSRDEKGLEIQRQAKRRVYCRASSAQQLIALPIEGGDAYRLATLVLRQLAASSHCNDNLMLVALRANAGQEINDG